MALSFTQQPIKYFVSLMCAIAFGALFSGIFFIPDWQTYVADNQLLQPIIYGLLIGLMMALLACIVTYNPLSWILMTSPVLAAGIAKLNDAEILIYGWIAGIQYGMLWLHFVLDPLLEENIRNFKK